MKEGSNLQNTSYFIILFTLKLYHAGMPAQAGLGCKGRQAGEAAP